MQFDAEILAIFVSLISAGCAVVCFAAQRRLRKTVAEQQQEIARHLAALSSQLAQPVPSASEAALPPAPPELAATEIASAEDPETVAVLTAAIAGFLGHRARIRSLRHVSAESAAVSAWSQQGRAFVQSSHNFNPHR